VQHKGEHVGGKMKNWNDQMNKKPCTHPWACIGLQACAMQIRSHVKDNAKKRMVVGKCKL
jgi:hypothetical protein